MNKISFSATLSLDETYSFVANANGSAYPHYPKFITLVDKVDNDYLKLVFNRCFLVYSTFSEKSFMDNLDTPAIDEECDLINMVDTKNPTTFEFTIKSIGKKRSEKFMCIVLDVHKENSVIGELFVGIHSKRKVEISNIITDGMIFAVRIDSKTVVSDIRKFESKIPKESRKTHKNDNTLMESNKPSNPIQNNPSSLLNIGLLDIIFGFKVDMTTEQLISWIEKNQCAFGIEGHFKAIEEFLRKEEFCGKNIQFIEERDLEHIPKGPRRSFLEVINKIVKTHHLQN
ncbi:hypothetical protein ABK040_007366 [Willaertia magna]